MPERIHSPVWVHQPQIKTSNFMKSARKHSKALLESPEGKQLFGWLYGAHKGGLCCTPSLPPCVTSECAPRSPRAATSRLSSRVRLPSPSHGPHAGSTPHGATGDAKAPQGAGNVGPPAAGGSWVANDAKTNLPIQPSRLWDVTGILYPLSAPVPPPGPAAPVPEAAGRRGSAPLLEDGKVSKKPTYSSSPRPCCLNRCRSGVPAHRRGNFCLRN